MGQTGLPPKKWTPRKGDEPKAENVGQAPGFLCGIIRCFQTCRGLCPQKISQVFLTISATGLNKALIPHLRH